MLFRVLLLTLAFFFQSTYGLDYGKAYLVRVANNTLFPVSFSLEGIPGKEITIEPSAALGKVVAGPNLGEKIGALFGQEKKIPTIAQLNTSPIIRGFGLQEVAKFSRDSMLLLKPLYGQGAAWIDQELSPLEATLSCRANVPDGGEVHLCFGIDKTHESTWRIVFGAMDNTKALLYKGDTPLIEASHDLFPEAQIKPGLPQDFWASIDRTRIMAGVGSPGSNLILAFDDPTPIGDTKLAGLSCGEKVIVYSDVQLGPPVRPIPPKEKHWQAEKFPEGAIPLREPGTGTIEFTAPRDGSCILLLRNDYDTSEKCLITATDEAVIVAFLPTGEDAQPYVFPLNKKYERIWISIANGRMLIGNSNKVCGVISDPWFEFATSFAFSGKPENITLSSPTNLELDIKRGASTKREFAGRLDISVPFFYKFTQKGQTIEGVDVINGQTYILGKAPQQDAKYYFEINLKPDGIPDLSWATPPVNMRQFSIDATAFSLRLAEAGMYMAADIIGSPSEGTEGEGTEGFTVQEQIARAITSANLAAGGTIARIVSSIYEAKSKYDFRSEGAYVYTEKIRETKGIETVSQKAKANRAAVEQKLKFAAQTRGRNRKDFDFLMSTMLEVITLTTSSYVVNDEKIKNQIYDTINSLVGLRNIIAQQVSRERWSQKVIETTTQAIWTDLITLLLAAIRNEYLTNEKIDFEAEIRKKWKKQLQTISQEFFGKRTWGGFSIPPAYGEYLETGKAISSISGSVYFEAKGAGDLLVGFIPEGSIVKPGSFVYETGIGVNGNSETEARLRHLKDAVEWVSADENPSAALSPYDFRPYWISIKNGIITIGQGVWGANIILECKDPYPSKQNLNLALSSWNTPIEIRNVLTGPAVEDLSEEKVKEIRDEAAKAEKPSIPFEKPMERIPGIEQEEDILTQDVLEQDRLKYDLLKLASMEMKYDELSYEDLSFEALERTHGEEVLTLQAEEKPIEEKKTFEEPKKIFEKPKRTAMAGHLVRLQQMGPTAVLMELRMLPMEMGQIVGVAKKIALAAARAVTYIGKLITKPFSKAGRASLKASASKTFKQVKSKVKGVKSKFAEFKVKAKKEGLVSAVRGITTTKGMALQKQQKLAKLATEETQKAKKAKLATEETPKTEKEIIKQIKKEKENRIKGEELAKLSEEAKELQKQREALDNEMKKYPDFWSIALRYVGKTVALPILPIVKLIGLRSEKAKNFASDISVFKQIGDDLKLMGDAAKQWAARTKNIKEQLKNARSFDEAVEILDKAAADAYKRSSTIIDTELSQIRQLTSIVGQVIKAAMGGKGSIYETQYRNQKTGKILRLEDLASDAKIEQMLRNGEITREVALDPITGKPKMAPVLDDDGYIKFATVKDHLGRDKKDADGNVIYAKERVPKTDEYGNLTNEEGKKLKPGEKIQYEEQRMPERHTLSTLFKEIEELNYKQKFEETEEGILKLIEEKSMKSKVGKWIGAGLGGPGLIGAVAGPTLAPTMAAEQEAPVIAPGENIRPDERKDKTKEEGYE